MAVLHWDLIKAIQSLVFDYCGIFGSAKVLSDVPFKSDTQRQNVLCCGRCVLTIETVLTVIQFMQKRTYDKHESPKLVGILLTHC